MPLPLTWCMFLGKECFFVHTDLEIKLYFRSSDQSAEEMCGFMFEEGCG